jgi:hypothetical protein
MIQLILRKQFKKSAKGIDPLLEYNCLCLQVNPTVGCRTGREVNHPMIKTHLKKNSTHLVYVSTNPTIYPHPGADIEDCT